MKFRTLFLIALLIFVSTVLLAHDPKWRTPISMSPASPAVGDSITFTCEFKQGRGEGNNIRIVGKIDGAIIWDHTFPHFNDQQVQNMSYNWTATAGAHTAEMIIDPDNTSGDENTTNNTVSLAFTVGGSSTGSHVWTPTHTALARPELNSDYNTPERNCFLSMKAPTDLTVFNLGPLMTNPTAKVVQFKVQNTGDRCIKEFSWAIYDAHGNRLTTFTALPVGSDSYALYGKSERRFTATINKSDITQWDKCIPRLAKDQTTKPNSTPSVVFTKTIAQQKDLCINIHVVVDYNNKVGETDESNNNSTNLELKFKQR